MDAKLLNGPLLLDLSDQDKPSKSTSKPYRPTLMKSLKSTPEPCPDPRSKDVICRSSFGCPFSSILTEIKSLFTFSQVTVSVEPSALVSVATTC